MSSKEAQDGIELEVTISKSRGSYADSLFGIFNFMFGDNIIDAVSDMIEEQESNTDKRVVEEVECEVIDDEPKKLPKPKTNIIKSKSYNDVKNSLKHKRK